MIPSHTTDPVATTRNCGDPGAQTDSDQLRYLNLFRVYHQVLTQAENDALRLVEVEKAGYGEAAEVMRVPTDVVKRLVFLARQKLFFGMGQTLGDLAKEPAA